ncbi:MAG: hypothetical protein JWR81_3912, partial [Pseudonocardia sp.]|nr:hypothetical protein [Pseudonocardia sp.]
MAGKFKPMTGGVLFWARPDTIRLRPWCRVPFTSGDRRTVVDVVLYLALLVTLLAAIVLPGVPSATLSAAVPGNTTGLVNPALLVAPAVLLVLCGLRDKTLFLAARGEQYLPAMVFFAVLPFVDMIIALKLLIVVVWIGAGVSKFGLRFSNVVAPMVSNSPSVPAKWFKRMQYRDFPRDLRPSRVASTLAQIERFAPGFRDRIVGTQARTTTGFAAYNANYVGGDILTGAKTIAQVVLGPRAILDPYRIGVPGMFLLGGHPARPRGARHVRRQRRRIGAAPPAAMTGRRSVRVGQLQPRAHRGDQLRDVGRPAQRATGAGL